jgi:hypothetical protein
MLSPACAIAALASRHSPRHRSHRDHPRHCTCVGSSCAIPSRRSASRPSAPSRRVGSSCAIASSEPAAASHCARTIPLPSHSAPSLGIHPRHRGCAETMPSGAMSHAFPPATRRPRTAFIATSARRRHTTDAWRLLASRAAFAGHRSVRSAPSLGIHPRYRGCAGARDGHRARGARLRAGMWWFE